MKNSAVLSLVNETSEKVTVFDLTGCKRSWTDGGVNVYADNFVFQSTHPMRGATRCDVQTNGRYYISIHAPHAGCDRDSADELAKLIEMTTYSRGEFLGKAKSLSR